MVRDAIGSTWQILVTVGVVDTVGVEAVVTVVGVVGFTVMFSVAGEVNIVVEVGLTIVGDIRGKFVVRSRHMNLSLWMVIGQSHSGLLARSTSTSGSGPRAWSWVRSRSWARVGSRWWAYSVARSGSMTFSESWSGWDSEASSGVSLR
jgi:hypothetical protein